MPGPIGGKRPRRFRWWVIAAAVVAIIALSVGVSILLNDGDPPATIDASAAPSDVASADDKGPVTVIDQEPTCDAQRVIFDRLSQSQRQPAWVSRDEDIPAGEWSPDLRRAYEDAAQLYPELADELRPLAKRTPHRVMRELYEQQIVYLNAFADKIPTYAKPDNELLEAANAARSTLIAICGAIEYRSASARGLLVEPPPAPTSFALIPSGDLEPFVSAGAPGCDEFVTAANANDENPRVKAWIALDPNISSSNWTPEQREISTTFANAVTARAADMLDMAQRSDNPTFADFVTLASQYWLAFAKSAVTYTPADNYLSDAATNAGRLIYRACISPEA